MEKNKDYVLRRFKEKPVFVVSKTYCPYARTAKATLQRYNIPEENIEILEIDESDYCDEIQNLMLQITGARTVPRVFIGGNCIGGGSETKALHDGNQLRSLLEQAGAFRNKK